MKSKIVILFNGSHLSYSPTVISLYDLLSQYFDVVIVSPSYKNFNNKPLPNRNVVYLKTMKSSKQYRVNNMLFSLLASFYKEFAVLKKNKVSLEIFYEFFQIKKQISKLKPDIIIAVDFKNLWYAEILGKNVEFLSLEISKDDGFYDKCNQNNINSVIIQTQNRYQYLFENKELKTFLIQNAPIFKQSPPNNIRKGLVYCGTAWDPFGFYHCLEFLREYPQYSLTVKGALLQNDRHQVETNYSDILLANRLIIDDAYSDDSEILSYLSKFQIGFCFYNFEIDWVNTFNYFSAPSGKMFKYFAAGVPVIGNDIEGLLPIKEFDCGVLIKDLSPKSIKAAIATIEQNFDYYSKNCLKAAKHFSFDKAAKPFIEYLLEYDKNRAHHRSNRSGRSISV